MSQKNVLGGDLETCCTSPMTGFFRDGHCRTSEEDRGSHTVCALITAEFLAFCKKNGNDLSTPNVAAGFRGLVPGDKWCLCVARWEEAFLAGQAPPIVLGATHERALEVVKLDELKAFAVDWN